MNLFLKDIENEGTIYGLKLNKGKFELLTTSLNADIKFADGTKVKRKPEVTYLGCQLNQYSNISQEISKRIANCMTILKRLDIFWRHCDVKIAFKITAMDAVIRAKLLYGIDSAQLTPSHQRRIGVFQLKGLRNILKMNTTFVERNNSNAEVFRRANGQIQNETEDGAKPKKVVPFVTCYLNSRMKKLSRMYKMPDENPVKHITLARNAEGHIIPWTPPNRRVGRPRFQWVTETMKDVWNNIRTQPPHTHTSNETLATKSPTRTSTRLSKPVSLKRPLPPASFFFQQLRVGRSANVANKCFFASTRLDKSTTSSTIFASTLRLTAALPRQLAGSRASSHGW